MLNDTPHVVFDVVLVAVALTGVFVFIFFDRPRLQVALMLYVATVWAVELTFIANGVRASRLLSSWHPIFAVSTTLAAFGIILLRRRERR